MYAVVFFKRGSQVETREAVEAHERFIDLLVSRNQILLGGRFKPIAADCRAAYVLHCDSLYDAKTIASADPFFRDQIYEADVVEWELVGINPKAIESEIVLAPAVENT